ncbi:MAG: hypothetical protein HY474_01145 [Candidatus Sungbacteria bacterium]|uniref:Transcriptional repressor PaaX-like central Cas2-like domain-containing protein n=1 Tax=Candidatus Sungiibacteriota bacterium TaxID=2750080 RepID=A0A932YXR9_9BACT|nr:hypothetical protein [Candidatus Sungbacteria bacterium]
MGRRIHKHSLASDLLRLFGAGAILAAVLVAPNIGIALHPFLKRADFQTEREWRRAKVKQALERLRKRRLVQFVEKGKRTYIEITELGKQRLQEFEFDALQLSPPKRWDGKWRLAIFDIPEKYKRERETLRRKLADLGFQQLQRSVWVYPFDCRDEIDFVCGFLGISHWVHYLETLSIDSAEGKMRRHFDLLV